MRVVWEPNIEEVSLVERGAAGTILVRKALGADPRGDLLDICKGDAEALRPGDAKAAVQALLHEGVAGTDILKSMSGAFQRRYNEDMAAGVESPVDAYQRVSKAGAEADRAQERASKTPTITKVLAEVEAHIAKSGDSSGKGYLAAAMEALRDPEVYQAYVDEIYALGRR